MIVCSIRFSYAYLRVYVMEHDKSALERDYSNETSKKTLMLGRLFSVVGIPLLVLFSIQDLYLFQGYESLIWRGVSFAGMACFIVGSFTVLKKHIKCIVPFHMINLFTFMCMMNGLVLIVYSMPESQSNLRIGVLNGLLVDIFIAFIFAGGARKYIPYLIAGPFIVLCAVLFFATRLPWNDWTLFSNPALAIVAVSFMAIMQERVTYQEFVMRTMALHGKSELEGRIEDVTRLNRELTKTLGKLQLEIEERKQFEEMLEKQVRTDELTGAYNRRAGLEMLESFMRMVDTYDEEFTLCFIDVDDLKAVNDKFGHREGDQLLKQVAKALQSHTRGNDVVCRMGGDEFIVLFPRCSEKNAEQVMQRVQDYLSLQKTGEGSYSIGISWGFSHFSKDDRLSVKELLQLADDNMYREKQRKKT